MTSPLLKIGEPQALAAEFEAKARDLVQITRRVSIPQLLFLRRATLDDADTYKWASRNQLQTIFISVLSEKLQEVGGAALLQAKAEKFERLLPPLGDGYDAERRENDRESVALAAAPVIAAADRPKAFSLECLLRPLGDGYTEAQREKDRENLTQVARKLESMLQPAFLDAMSAPAPAPAFSLDGLSAFLAPTRTADPLRLGRFEKAFDDTICERIRKALVPLAVSDTRGKPGKGLPFMAAPSFGESFEKALRAFVLPNMRKARAIRTLEEAHNWQEDGAETILEVIGSGETKNSIFFAWDGRWNDFRERNTPFAPGVTDDGPALWAQLRKDALSGGYVPPTAKDIGILRASIRFDPEEFNQAMDEMKDLYMQEFTPKLGQETGREGSFRDGLNKWRNKLPPHVGEFIAIVLYFSISALDIEFLKNFSRNHGKNTSERMRKIPYFMSFLEEQGVIES